MAGPYVGFGALLSTGGVTVAGVRDIAGPGIKTTSIDVSTRDARARKFMAGMYDAGEVTFDVVYDPDAATHLATGVGLVGLALAGTTTAWVLTFPDAAPAATCSFSGFISGFSAKEPMDGALTADVTVKISGVPLWA